MKKISFLALAAALTMAFMSCSNGSDDATAAVSGAGASTTVPTLEAGTYSSTGNTWSRKNVTVTLTSATEGTFKLEGEERALTFNSIDSTTGGLKDGDTDLDIYILKSGNDLYIVGDDLGGESETLFTTWTMVINASGDVVNITFNSNGTYTAGNFAAGTFTNSNGFITLTYDGESMYMFYANNKLYGCVAKLTKQS